MSNCKKLNSIFSHYRPTVTVTGAKNAKLICIRDDNSIIVGSSSEDEENDQQKKTKLTSSGTQTDLKEIEPVKNTKSTIKISRLPKNKRKALELLPKDYAVNIIQYKLEYQNLHKDNPMYRKSASVQPWMLMGK